ncbi:MAG: C4-type zinc ribbon domain-containing protein [Candidatus Kuenenia sp.]|nr:C4-type zinc ribbon domain-containing protein [Candidatus Kuenenia sp.]
MSEKIETLRRLQSIDSKLKRLEGDKLYRAHDIEKKKGEIKKKRDELVGIVRDTKNYQKNIGMKELELKTKEGEIDKLNVQMNQAKTNKEFSAFKTEIGGKEADKSLIEDAILGMITKLEEMQQRQSTFGKEIAHEEVLLIELQKKVETDMKAMDAEIAALKEKRNKFASLLDNNTLQQYNRLTNNKDGIAVVGVVNKVCQSCFMSVTSQTINLLMSNKDIMYCHSCGRILYLDDGGNDREEL